MKTKEEIYLSVRTQKKADKLKKVLKMFNQKTYSAQSIDTCVNSAGDLVIHYDGEEFLNTHLSVEGLEDKTKVTIKELKNILALEYLKEGDVIILAGGEEKYKWVVEVDCVEENLNFPITVYPSNFIGLDGVEKYDGDNSGISGQFVRFATKDEKELMNGKKVTASEPLVEIGNWYWFQHPEFEKRALVYVNDISKSCNGNFGFNYEHEWMTGEGDESFGVHYTLEGGCFYIETTITKATDEEVKDMLAMEANLRGLLTEGVTIGNTENDFEMEMSPNYKLKFSKGELTLNWPSESWTIFHNGKWAKVVEEQESGDKPYDSEDEPKVGDVVEFVIVGEPYSFITTVQKIYKSPYEHDVNPYIINGWVVVGKPKILKTNSEIIDALKPF